MRVFYKKQHPDGSELMEKTVLRTVSDVTVLSVRLLFTCAHDIVDNRRERRKHGIIIPGKNFYQIIIAAVTAGDFNVSFIFISCLDFKSAS